MSSGYEPRIEHGLYAYSALPARARLAWPGDARVAFWICVHLEYWELDPPPGSLHPPGIEGTWQIHAPDYRTYAHREYGNRIGVFRVFDALEEAGFKATASVNAEVCRRYPGLIEQCLRRDWEIAAGGTHATRMITSRMSDNEERSYVAECRQAVADAAGTPPQGWIGQDFNESPRTPRIVADLGFSYIADWPNDEQPYWMNTPAPLVSIPQQTEWDDVTLLWMRQVTTDRFESVVLEGFRRIWEDGASNGRLFVLNVHPWLFGQPHRIRYLRRILRAIAGHGGVWHTNAAAIAAHFRTQAEAKGSE